MADNFYPRSGVEIDLRQELINTFAGTGIEISKKCRGILRQMSKDSNGDLILCECVDPVTHEPDKDYYCSLCLGEGFRWTEIWLDYYKKEVNSDAGSATALKLTPFGLLEKPPVVFWLLYNTDVESHDKIVEINLDIEGTVPSASLQRRVAVYRIHRIDTLRADGGRIEFLKAYCIEEDVRFLNGQ